MFFLSSKIRKNEKSKYLRQKGILPAVLYGNKIKNISLKINEKEFEKIYKQAGQTSLISLEVENSKNKFLVLIHAIQRDALTNKFIHIDFYQSSLDQEIEAKIPLILTGTAFAEKELGGTLIKHIQEIEVKALPENLPHQIEVEIDCLKTFDDNILIKDLKTAKQVKILKREDEIVVSVSPPEKVEEELEKPVEEKVEEVEKIEKDKKSKEAKIDK